MAENSPNLYEARNLKFSYFLGKERIPALRSVSLTIEKAGFYCLFGPSGSGKTTLLNILGLIEKPQEGDVLFDGISIKQMAEAEKNLIRKKRIGYVFQTFHLFPVLTAFENVEYFLARQGLKPKKQRQKLVEEALHEVGLWDLRNQRPFEMSGGQRQRVAVARAMVKNPDAIIADEPTASLDQKTGSEIMSIFQKLNTDRGVTVLISSHDAMVQSFARTRVRLADGAISSEEPNNVV